MFESDFLRLVLQFTLSPKIIKGDHFRFHAQIVQHGKDRLHHEGRAAQIVFDFRGIFMGGQIVVVGGQVDEPGQAFPMVPGLGVGQGHEIGKVIELVGQFGEFFVVEHLLSGPGAIPEGDFPVGLFGQKQVADMGAHGRHAGTAADKTDFAARVPDKKIAVRPAQGHFFTGGQVEYVRRTDPGRGIGFVPGRRGDADRELEYPLFVG